MVTRDDTPLVKTRAWRRLEKHRRRAGELCLREAFRQDPDRARRFSLDLGALFIDYSRNLITAETLSLLLQLAEERALGEKIQGLFNGERLNVTERRPALHTLLRAPEGASLEADGVDLARQARAGLQRMLRLAADLRGGRVQGASGETIDRVVNIGIGGADLGPRLLADALGEFCAGAPALDFVANVDPVELERVLARANPHTTLFVVSSKSFATAETLANAARARDWLQSHGCTATDKHFIAVSGNTAAVARSGLEARARFDVPEWVGGRYSVWSCAGLTAAVGMGEENFRRFLAGGHAVDQHFRSAAFSANAPVVLGLLSVWHNNFLGVGAHAVVPYEQRLRLLPAYLGQLVMESNGKSVTADGSPTATPTAQVTWGGTGSNAQHAFFQFLHQGARRSSVDLLLPLGGPHDDRRREMLAAACLAQGEALMRGCEDPEPARRLEGNRPAVTILYDALSPRTLGMLLALYEHKTFVEAAVWGINPFDQWGVELGKQLAGRIAEELEQGEIDPGHDASTRLLMEKYLTARGRRR